MAFQGNHNGISTYFGLDKDIWLNDMLNSLLWTGELVSEARSKNGYGKGFLLGQDMENRGHIITTSPVISKIILTRGRLVVRLCATGTLQYSYPLINPYSPTLAQNIQALAEVASCRGCLVNRARVNALGRRLPYKTISA